ncbi:MAG: hypothetical protein ABI591_27095 [Kofleriaceae bacterium]
MTVAAALAEDVVQDALTRLFGELERFDRVLAGGSTGWLVHGRELHA